MCKPGVKLTRDFKITHGALLILDKDVAIFSCIISKIVSVKVSTEGFITIILGTKGNKVTQHSFSFWLSSFEDCALCQKLIDAEKKLLTKEIH